MDHATFATAHPLVPPMRQRQQAEDSPEIERHPSDEGLMRSLRDDDPKALGILLDRYWGALKRYASGKLGRVDEAEDLVQEVFVRLWEHRKRWEATGSVQAYLYQITRNLVIGRTRHAKVRRRAEPELRWLSRDVRTPVEDIAHTELREALEDALEVLPPRRREAFLLVRFQGLSLREAAQVMDVTRRTVANHVYMAASDLGEALDHFLE